MMLGLILSLFLFPSEPTLAQNYCPGNRTRVNVPSSYARWPRVAGDYLVYESIVGGKIQNIHAYHIPTGADVPLHPKNFGVTSISYLVAGEVFKVGSQYGVTYLYVSPTETSVELVLTGDDLKFGTAKDIRRTLGKNGKAFVNVNHPSVWTDLFENAVIIGFPGRRVNRGLNQTHTCFIADSGGTPQGSCLTGGLFEIKNSGAIPRPAIPTKIPQVVVWADGFTGPSLKLTYQPLQQTNIDIPLAPKGGPKWLSNSVGPFTPWVKNMDNTLLPRIIYATVLDPAFGLGKDFIISDPNDYSYGIMVPRISKTWNDSFDLPAIWSSVGTGHRLNQIRVGKLNPPGTQNIKYQKVYDVPVTSEWSGHDYYDDTAFYSVDGALYSHICPAL